MPSDGKSSHCLWQGELKKKSLLLLFLLNESICMNYSLQIKTNTCTCIIQNKLIKIHTFFFNL
jgi:hypothetical protein